MNFCIRKEKYRFGNEKSSLLRTKEKKISCEKNKEKPERPFFVNAYEPYKQ